MNIEQRVKILIELKNYLTANTDELKSIKEEANYRNSWFTPEFIEIALQNIIEHFLDESKLKHWMGSYNFSNENTNKKLGIVMAGNIPAVGFHDFLCAFICGHHVIIKPSSKDDVLIKHFVQKMAQHDIEINTLIEFRETLKDCNAYIATGSNNSSRYFEYYFSKFPHIIRRNRTSVAILNGEESNNDLQLLAKDIQLFFGQGCRNITHLFVPKEYNFEPLIVALKEYQYFLDLHKYKNNYDYQLALLMLNNKYYMTDGSVLLTENESLFSAISCVHFSYYENKENLVQQLKGNDNVQCIVGNGFIDFGQAQQPSLTDYADGVDTMQFLTNL